MKKYISTIKTIETKINSFNGAEIPVERYDGSFAIIGKDNTFTYVQMGNVYLDDAPFVHRFETNRWTFE